MNKMNALRRCRHVLVWLLCAALHATSSLRASSPPEILNLRVSLDESAHRVTATFDLQDTENQPCEISVQLSDDDGQSFLHPTNGLSGEFGYPVSPGPGRQIQWLYDPAVTDLSPSSTNRFWIKLAADDRQPVNIQALVDQVNPLNLSNDLAIVQGIRHVTGGPEHYQVVRRFILDRFARLGLRIWEQPFGTGTNLVGLAPGFAEENTLFILDAHFDSTEISPGANDNGSGVVGMLEAARILAGIPKRRTLAFIGFDREEAGFGGSKAFVARGIRPGTDLRAVLNLEQIGYQDSRPRTQYVPGEIATLFPALYQAVAEEDFRANFAGQTGSSNAAPFQTEIQAAAARYVPGLRLLPLTLPRELESVTAFRRSDQAPFWDAGYPAIVFSDTGENRSPYYHTAEDTMEKLTFPFMADVMRVIVGTLAEWSAVSHATVVMARVPTGVSINWTPPPPITYGTALGAQQLNASANAPGTLGYDPPAGSLLPAGEGHVLLVRFTPAEGGAPTASASVPLTVLPAPLNIRADDQLKLQGAVNPPLTASYSGFVLGETPADLAAPPILSTTATSASAPGYYPIAVSGASSSNYDITFVPGTLTVEALPRFSGFGLAPSGGIRLEVQGWPDRSYEVLYSVDLSVWQTAALVHANASGQAWFEDNALPPENPPARYYRLMRR
jgi:hypothetical protein